MAKWNINANHSSVAFEVRHMMVSWVHGLFTKVTGILDFDPLEVEQAAVEVEIDARSIYTGLEQRDRHLKSEDFLEAEKYPAIAFKSNRVELAGLDHAYVHGGLTIRGVTRPVVLDAHWAGPSLFDDDGKIYTSFGFRAATVINREDFGMIFNMEMEHGGFMIGKQVHLTLNAEVDLLEE
ncbi:MAG: polyisoprenoid-binding protein [Deltaproteobacteria bacterium]|nr:MAG: polyisoprenoid-binding protein [Deltaproteobacteria bacterium]